MKIKLIDFGGKFPYRAHDNDAGADVYSPAGFVLEPGQVTTVSLGFGVELPDGFVGFVFPRSSLSSKGIVCELPPIDSGYRGEIHAVISNVSSVPYEIRKGDRIGQLVVLPCLIPDFVTELGEQRGAGAFGSTGV